MRTVLITAVSTAVCAFVAATPAFAQATVTGAPPGSAPVTVEGYGFGPGQPGQPGIGNDYPGYYGYGYGYGPGYGYYAPPRYYYMPRHAYHIGRRHCHVYRDAVGRRICGP
jgi:hypothetical protein